MEIYLDNAATTRPRQEVIERMVYVLEEVYGNPSSLHQKGIDAEKIIKDAAEFLKTKVSGSKKGEIIFTSGGTESNNLAILGVAAAYKRYGNKIITTNIEHSSVKESMKYLSENGFEIYTLKVDKKGYINLDELKQTIDDRTILVSIMHVNNEIGTIQDLVKIGNIIKDKNPETFFHVDAVQGFTKYPISAKQGKIDLISVSAHKFYAPKGVGFLYKGENVRLKNIIFGGGQQKNLRSGTENVAGIGAMKTAAEIMFKEYKNCQQSMIDNKNYFANQILATIENASINGDLANGAFHILNVTFKGIRSEVLLHALEAWGIFVSSGSACSSNSVVKKETTLTAIGVTEGAIRFSFGIDTTKEELDFVLKILQEQTKLLATD
ncbi:MAG: cysteine desulfurase [Candidatus Epulonipiscioides saccharophilum]|nr:MAG: cysteine desulfurase [Epulopiscium sp. AS2M-Bin001]